MLIRIASDLHIEFFNYARNGLVSYKDIHENEILPVMENEKEHTLVLAGDIVMAKKIAEFVPFFEGLSKRFKNIIYVMGNHEHYRFHFKRTLPTIREALRHIENLHIMENNEVFLDGVVFIGATLWTDFDNENPFNLGYAETAMSDFMIIENGPVDMPSVKNMLKPIQTVLEHRASLEIIRQKIKANKGNKIVVVTHHAPSQKSSELRWLGNALNPAFYTNLEYFIEEYEPKLWIHGHMHNPSDYVIGKTRVICNPLGYGKGEEQRSGAVMFNKRLLLEVA